MNCAKLCSGAKNTVDLDQVYTRGVPNYDWNGKTLHFIRNGPAKGFGLDTKSTN